MKYTLWSLFFFVVFGLFLGLVKFRFNLGEYVTFLNTRNVGALLSKGAFDQLLWKNSSGSVVGSLDEALSGDIDVVVSGDDSLDIYDPAFEEDFKNILQDSDLSGVQEEDFGFVDPYTDSDVGVGTGEKSIVSGETSSVGFVTGSVAGNTKQELLDLIKIREAQ